jgi:hypothetical protein
MRPFLSAAAAAFTLLLAPTSLAVAADQLPVRPPLDATALYRQPTLDGVTLTFAYDRMEGITPDFRPYAERSTAYASATAFDRDAVLAREIARSRQQFQDLDLARVYDVRLRTELRQYDAVRGGYALVLGEDSFIPIHDPVTLKEYGLELRNTGDVNFIPVADATAARAFAERFRLYTQGSFAATVVLQMALRLVEVPPAVDQGGPVMVRADILAARILNSSTDTVVYDFGLTPAAARAPSGSDPESALSGAQAVLKAADVQGLHLGMVQAEAEAVAAQGWTTKRGSQEAGQVLWFNDLQARRDDWAVCGGLANGRQSEDERREGVLPPSYKDCIGYGFVRVAAGNGSYGDRVGQVAAEQFLAAGDLGTLRQALEEKYGKPTYVRNEGNDLVWVGRDPAKPDEASVKIGARMGIDNGQAGHRFVLEIGMVPYVDPQRPLPMTGPPAITGRPRL